MTPEDVRARVEAIRAVADDEEDAHGKEDDLRADVLRVIANGSPHAQALALEALATEAIQFRRWYA